MNNKKYLNIKIPSSIDAVIEGALQRGVKEKRKTKIRVLRRGSIAVAASLALIMIIGTVNPTAASEIPILNNVFKYLNDRATNKSMYEGGDQYKYASEVNLSAKDKGIEITVNEIYCDGCKVYISYTVKGDEKFSSYYKDMDTVPIGWPKIETELCENTKLSINDEVGKYIDDYTYIGSIVADITELTSKGIEIKDDFKLKLEISEVADPKSGEKDIPSNSTIGGKWSFNLETAIKDENNKILKPNIESNGCILKQVSMSPSMTQIVFESNKLPEGAMAIIKDNNGKYVEWNQGGGYLAENGDRIYIWEYAKVEENAESLTITIIDKNDDCKELAAFTFKIK